MVSRLFISGGGSVRSNIGAAMVVDVAIALSRESL